MPKVLTGVLLFILVLTSACQHQSAHGLTTTKPAEKKIKSTNVSVDYPGIYVESKIVEYDDYQYAVHFPKIESETWNRELELWAGERINMFKQETEELRVPGTTWPLELHIDFEIYDMTDKFISVKLIESKFLGGAHTEEMIYSYNFNREKQQLIALPDLFQENSNYLEVLSKLSGEKLLALPDMKKLLQDEYFKSGIRPKEDNFKQFAIKDGLFILFFQRYQVGPNSIGSPEIELTEGELQHILKEDYLTSSSDQNVVVELEIDEKVAVEETSILDPNKKHVALTFDDGPHHSVTSKILDALTEHHAHATFFVLGNRVEFHPELLLRMKAEGHEIGNHTWSHPQLTNLSQEEIREQVSSTDGQIMKITGEPATLVRPPYGAINETTLQSISHPIVNWSVDTRDWKSRNAESILKEVQKQVRDGSIILMHDIYPSTAEAVGNVLSWLSQEGYQVVTVSQLLGFGAGETVAEAGKVYSSQ
ncbi:polysaccharide deacetylase family protein [bacterium LRH843]|nr:polysaccharide deacetylase family protein [bacterium LRH843]